MTKPYEVIDHIADIGIIVRGGDEKELFANAGYALFDLIADLDTVGETERVEILAEGSDREDLFLNWLRELLNVFNLKGLLLKRFDVWEVSGGTVTGRGYGEPMDASRHVMRREIKAATYHMLEVKKTGRGWKAQVIFDI